MRTNQIAHCCIRQTVVGKGIVVAGELQVTVRAYLGGSECGSVEAERKWQRDSGRGIIRVVASIGCPRNDGSGPDGDDVIGAGGRGRARNGGGGRGGGSSSRSCRGWCWRDAWA